MNLESDRQPYCKDIFVGQKTFQFKTVFNVQRKTAQTINNGLKNLQVKAIRVQFPSTLPIPL